MLTRLLLYGAAGLLISSAAQPPRHARLQLKPDGQSLDAAYCATPIGLHPGSTYAGGACQLWKLVPNGEGQYRRRLKVNHQDLDAVNCAAKVGLNPGSASAHGACQFWRLVPESARSG